jgi:DivIVA domain-containing protein
MTATLPNHHLSLPEGVEMPLTPDEIAAKSFPSVLRGYAKWEVDEFLKDVALDYQRALGLAEWAMQRSAPASAPAASRPETAADAPTQEDEKPTALGLRTADEAAAASTLPAGEPQAQIDRLGEHIRYLAILVNSMSQRIDFLETRAPSHATMAPTYPAPYPPTAPPSPASTDTTQAAAAPVPPPQAQPVTTDPRTMPLVAAKDWWPSESPLWVVTREPAGSPNSNRSNPAA